MKSCIVFVALASILSRSFSLSFPSFTCQSSDLLKNASIFTTCSGVVDYDFYLPATTSYDGLEEQARSLLIGYPLSSGSNCLSALKRVICAQVYLPCVDNVEPGNESTYDQITKLPYKRPCSDLCTSLVPAPASCNKAQLESLGNVFPNCSAIDSSTSMTLYDGSNNINQCNDLARVKNVKLVSDDVETYTGSLCSGMVSKFYVGNSSSINSTLAPLPFPNSLQNWLEETYVEKQTELPFTFSKECLQYEYKILCGTLFPATELADVIVNGNFIRKVNVPMLPDYNDCLYFQDICEKLISKSDELQNSFNCSAPKQFAGGLIGKKFPRGKQVVSRALKIYNIYANSYNLSAMSDKEGIYTVCPNGFSISADPDAAGQVLTTDVCAMNCPAPVYSEKQMDSSNRVQLVASWLNSAFISIQLINLAYQHKQRRNLLLGLIFSFSLSFNFYDAMQRAIVKSTSKLVCADRTSWHTVDFPSQTDETGSDALLARSCHFYSLLYLFMEFLFYSVVLALFAELYCRIVLKNCITKYRPYYLGALLLYSIFNSLLMVTYGGPKMILPGTPGTRCNYSLSNTDEGFYIRQLPHVVFYLACFLMGAMVCIKASHMHVTRGRHQGENPLLHMWKADSILLLYMLLFIFIYGPLALWVNWYVLWDQAALMKAGIKEWTQCVFREFKTTDDQARVDAVCGQYPDNIIPVTTTVPIVLLGVLYNFVLCAISMDEDARNFWKRLFTGQTLAVTEDEEDVDYTEDKKEEGKEMEVEMMTLNNDEENANNGENNVESSKSVEVDFNNIYGDENQTKLI